MGFIFVEVRCFGCFGQIGLGIWLELNGEVLVHDADHLSTPHTEFALTKPCWGAVFSDVGGQELDESQDVQLGCAAEVERLLRRS